jgi:CHRD domain-containing protein/PEP-CTERM motif-containing protein
MKIKMILAALLCSAALASAQSYFANLSGANENPANNSPAIGSGTFTLNANNTLSYNVTYSGLTGTWSANHIHGPGGVGPTGVHTNAGIIFTLNNPTFGVPGSGTLSGTTAALNSQQLSWLTSEYLYVNIHSSTFGGGEIRGQILPVPEPSTWAMMAMGAMGTLWLVRRKRA